MGEPEAGSECAIGAAAAGEARRLGFGSQGVILGGQGESGPGARPFPSDPPPSAPSEAPEAPRPRHAPGSKGLTPLSESGRPRFGAEHGGRRGVLETLPVREGGRGGACPGSGHPWVPTGCESFVSFLVSPTPASLAVESEFSPSPELHGSVAPAAEPGREQQDAGHGSGEHGEGEGKAGAAVGAFRPGDLI